MARPAKGDRRQRFRKDPTPAKPKPAKKTTSSK